MTDTFTTLPLKVATNVTGAIPKFSVYPVPASAEITIQTDGGLSPSLIIRNMIGTIVYQTNSFGPAPAILQINVQQWPAGIYLVEMNTGTEAVVKKIVCE